MEIATILFTLQTLSFLAVVVLAFKAYQRRNRPAMDEAAMIPFSDDPPPGQAVSPETNSSLKH